MNKKKDTINELSLSGKVIELDCLRYTPFGLPVRGIFLLHSSELLDTGKPRQVLLKIRAVLLGTLALDLEGLSVGDMLHAWGFLAPVKKNSTELRFHIQKASKMEG